MLLLDNLACCQKCSVTNNDFWDVRAQVRADAEDIAVWRREGEKVRGRKNAERGDGKAGGREAAGVRTLRTRTRRGEGAQTLGRGAQGVVT